MITNTEACAETLSAFPRKFRFSSPWQFTKARQLSYHKNKDRMHGFVNHFKFLYVYILLLCYIVIYVLLWPSMQI